ncbi:MAG: glycosyltransferase family 9 protein [bacterium]|nr:glycosyltransferase family 9 protein [bacterium]
MDAVYPKKIVIVQIGKIGDMILTTPLFSGLKKMFPLAKLIVLSGNLNKDIPLHHPSVDEVIVFSKNIFRNFFLRQTSLSGIDLWIDTKDNHSKTGELMVRFFKPALSMGFNFGKKIYDIDLKDYVFGKHATRTNLTPVAYFEKAKFDKLVLPLFDIPESVRSDLRFKGNRVQGKINILVNVSAGTSSRYIGSDVWVSAIEKINSLTLSSFTLMGLEKDRSIINYIMEGLKNIDIKYIPTDNIIESAELIRNSDGVITPDTSVIHICSAFNVPVLGLYPEVKWNLEKFAPLSDHNEIVTSSNKDSLEGIKAIDIADGFIKLLEKINGGNAESRTRVRKEDH